MIGTLSAATLGYITGNTRGALYAVGAYKKLTRMPPIPSNGRKRKSSGSAGSSETGYKSRYTSKKRSVYKITKRSRVSAGKIAVDNQAPKVRGSSGRTKSKQSVRVTSEFRKKVKKAMEAAAIKGRYIEIDYDMMRFVNSDNQQATKLMGESFTPQQVLDAASVLWNDKPFTMNKIFTNPKNFTYNTVKIHVEDSYRVYELRNNSRRTFVVKLFNCKSKIKDQQSSPVLTWGDSLAVENNDIGANVRGANTTTLYNDPRFLNNWNNQWSANVTTVTLDPGQTYKYFVQGPKNHLYDFTKYVKDSVPQIFTNLTKESRFNFAIYYPDVVSTDLATAGRFTDPGPGTNISDGITFESKSVFKLRMPEQAGFVYPSTTGVGGEPQSMGLRRYSFAIYQRGQAQAGLVNRIDDENPTVIETDV